MAKKDEQDAPVETAAAQPAPTIMTDDAVATAPTTRSRNGLALAGVIGGGLVAAALLFGGGVAVGLALPGHGPVTIAQAGNPGGPGGQSAHGGQPGIQGHGMPGPVERDGDRPRPPQQRDADAQPEQD